MIGPAIRQLAVVSEGSTRLACMRSGLPDRVEPETPMVILVIKKSGNS